jgi:hypothetical protein
MARSEAASSAIAGVEGSTTCAGGGAVTWGRATAGALAGRGGWELSVPIFFAYSEASTCCVEECLGSTSRITLQTAMALGRKPSLA